MFSLSKVAVGFWFEWSNHFLGSLRLVSWLSPEEFRRGGDVGLLFLVAATAVGAVGTAGTVLRLARRDASWAN